MGTVASSPADVGVLVDLKGRVLSTNAPRHADFNFDLGIDGDDGVRGTMMLVSGSLGILLIGLCAGIAACNNSSASKSLVSLPRPVT